MSTHPHVRTLITFDGEPEPDPPDRPHRPGIVGLVTVVLVATTALAATAAVGGSPGDAAPPSPSVTHTTRQQCALGFACSPSAEVAARESLEMDALGAASHAGDPGSGGYRAPESSSAGSGCGCVPVSTREPLPVRRPGARAKE